MAELTLNTIEKKSLRDEYGSLIAELGDTHKDIVVLDSDLSCSTKTAKFAKRHPERFFNMGIAEADMISTAAGLASAGKKPYASTFAVFATGRAWDQIRQSVCLSKLNVKIVSTHGGITVGEDGPSHQAMEDVALMRVMPNMTVIVPADANETRAVITESLKTPGPMYIRLTREKFPLIHGEDCGFKLGKSRVVRDGGDIAILACGYMVYKSLQAANLLAEEGISCRVINMSSIKPIDEEAILRAATECKALVTAEEHSILGGLGSAVTEVVCENNPTPVVRVGMDPVFGKSGKSEILLEKFGMNTTAIVKAVHRSLSLKR